MYQYKFSDEDTKLIEQEEKNKSLLDSFDEVDKKYNSAFSGNQNQSLGLEKMTFTRPNEIEVENQAKNSLADYKNTELNGIEELYSTKQKNIDNEISTNKETAKEQKSELEKKYASLKQNASNDALKRGLARSSIIVNTLEAFDNSMLDNFVKINEELTKNINSLNSQKSLLEEQKQNALNSFDIAYAIKLSEKIDSINSSLDKKEQEIQKYNNEIAEKEAEYKRKKQQEAIDYAEFISEYGIGSIEIMKSGEKYEIAKQYFADMDKDQALKELTTNPIYKSQLGTYYNKLVTSLRQG